MKLTHARGLHARLSINRSFLCYFLERYLILHKGLTSFLYVYNFICIDVCICNSFIETQFLKNLEM